MHWYDDLPHVGYDINGKKVLRPAKGDELDKFLSTVEDPSAWYIVFVSIRSFVLNRMTGHLPMTRISSQIFSLRLRSSILFGVSKRLKFPMLDMTHMSLLSNGSPERAKRR